MNRVLSTLKALLKFYWRCIKLAFRDKFAKAVAWTGTVSVVASLAVAFVHHGDQEFLLTELPAWFFVSAFAAAVLWGFIFAPFQLYQEEQRAREAVEFLRTPKLAISLPKTGSVNVCLAGGTTESFSGNRQTTVSAYLTEVVCLQCENIGEVAVRGCRARVLSVRRISGEGTSSCSFTESIELPWRKENVSDLVADVPPGDTRRIWVGRVRTHGDFWIYREIKDLPIEAQQVFGPAGTYKILIQVDSDDSAPVQVLLEVKASEGPKPVSGMWRGIAEVAILEQGSPGISPTSVGLST